MRAPRTLLRPVIALLAVAGSATTIAALATSSAQGIVTTPDAVATTAPTVPSTMAVNSTQAVTGASVHDTTNTSATVLVTLSTTAGTLEFAGGTPSSSLNLTLATGYTAWSGSTIAFTGTSANIDTELANLEYVSPSTPAGATITVTAAALDQEAAGATVAYDPQVQHYFEYVPDSEVAWSTAQSLSNTLYFDGQEGYLATIPTTGVSSFVEQHLAASNVWAGGESFDAPTQSGASSFPQDFTNARFSSGDRSASNVGRVWIWADDEQQFTSSYSPYTFDSSYYGGPQAGQVITECTTVSGSCVFTNEDQWGGAEDDAGGWVDGDGASNNEGIWNASVYNTGAGEPNQTNFIPSSTDGVNNGEHYLELNAAGTTNWNDLTDTSSTTGNFLIAGYVVEFGDEVIGASNWTGGTSTTSPSIDVGGAPTAPTGVQTNVGSSSGTATVSWTAPSSGSPFSGYTVTATPLQGGATVTQACTSTPCTVTGLTPGTTYAVTVQATNSYGTSSPSTGSDVTIPSVPGAPTSVSVTASTTTNGQASVSFTAPSSNGGAPVTGYTVTATPAGGGTAVTQTCTSSPCAITGLANGTTYTVTVSATNEEGSSSPSTGATVTTPTVPGAPTGVSVIASTTTNGQASVSFTAPSSNGGAPVTGYTVKATPAGGGTAITQTCTVSPCTITGLSNGTTYTVTVSATNEVGSSSPSTGATVTTPTVPGAPTNVSVNGASSTGGKAVVSFTAPSSNGGAPITGYTVKATPVLGGTAVTQTCTASPCTITGLTNDTTYVFAVSAVNRVGSSLPGSATGTVTEINTTPTNSSGGSSSGGSGSSGSGSGGSGSGGSSGGIGSGSGGSSGSSGNSDGSAGSGTPGISVAGTGVFGNEIMVMVSPKSTASKHGLQVACGTNGSSLLRCLVHAYYRGRVVGTAVRVVHRRLTYATTQIKPNKRGRLLLRRSGHNGFKLSIRATITTLHGGTHMVSIGTREYKPFAPNLLTVRFAADSAKITRKTEKKIRKAVRKMLDVRVIECHVPTYRLSVNNDGSAIAHARAKALCNYLHSLGIQVKGTYVSSTRLTGSAARTFSSRSRRSLSAIASVTYWDLPHTTPSQA